LAVTAFAQAAVTTKSPNSGAITGTSFCAATRVNWNLWECWWEGRQVCLCVFDFFAQTYSLKSQLGNESTFDSRSHWTPNVEDRDAMRSSPGK
jgi:hypothetical protein